jgi:hypothetical protein
MHRLGGSEKWLQISRFLPWRGRFAAARPAGLEPATACLEGRCSIQLSYGRPLERGPRVRQRRRRPASNSPLAASREAPYRGVNGRRRAAHLTAADRARRRTRWWRSRMLGGSRLPELRCAGRHGRRRRPSRCVPALRRGVPRRLTGRLSTSVDHVAHRRKPATLLAGVRGRSFPS